MQPFLLPWDFFWKSTKILITLLQENILNFVLLRFIVENSREKKGKTSILDHIQRGTQSKKFHMALCSSILEYVYAEKDTLDLEVPLG